MPRWRRQATSAAMSAVAMRCFGIALSILSVLIEGRLGAAAVVLMYARHEMSSDLVYVCLVYLKTMPIYSYTD